VILWEQLRGNVNVGAPVALPQYPTKSVQVIGTFGSATCTIQGSNVITDPTYATLTIGTSTTTGGTTDAGSMNCVFTAAGLKKIYENTYWVRPSVNGGDDTTNLDVYLLCETER